MTGPHGHASPAAFRRALTDRLQGLAATSRWPLQHLQRQMAYDRLLERLYLADDGWVVKGAAAQPRRSSRDDPAATVQAGPQAGALRSEAGRRGLVLPGQLVIPDRARWEPGYAAEAAFATPRGAYPG